jgi:hypothetical protein
MGFPTIFAFFAIVLLLLNFRLKRLTREEHKAKVAFWQKERESLSVRKQSFSLDDYIHPDITRLQFPILELEGYDQLLFDSLTKKIDALSRKDMMNFSQLTNTEIRLRFGTANQTVIENNEHNYTSFIKALAEYGKLMEQHGEFNEAKNAFEICIALHSEYSQHYLSLAGLYAMEKNEEAFQQLCEKASLIDATIQSKIQDKLRAFWDTRN